MTRIMVVDDDPLICQLLTYQLSNAGYYVCTAQDGRDALKRLLFDQPDLILLDVVMPGMSGWDVCNQIRACSTIPVIMLTAKHADIDVVTGLDSGADDYIAKPFSLPQLLARIEAVLRRVGRGHDLREKNGKSTLYVSQPQTVVHTGVSSAVAHSAKKNTTTYAAQKTPTNHQGHASSQGKLGQTFAEARKKRGMTLHAAEAACGIRWEFLQAVERSRFDYIPRVELRQVLKTYSEFLDIDLHAALQQDQKPSSSTFWQVYLVVLVTTAAIAFIILAFWLF